MDALDNLANASLDASLVTQVCHILASLANDDAGLLGRHNRAQGQLGLGILLVGLGDDLAVGAEAWLVIHLHVVGKVRDIVAVGRDAVLLSRHSLEVRVR